MSDSDAGPSRWRRRFSTASIPVALPAPVGLPSLHNLRTALLGYLGEVESAVQARVGGDPADGVLAGESDDEKSPLSSGNEAAWTSGVKSKGVARRRRGKSDDGYIKHKGDVDQETETLLNHLSTLKNDVQAYLPAFPFRVPLAATPGAGAITHTQEWLKTLPGKLRQLEGALPGTGLQFPFPFAAYTEKGKIRAGSPEYKGEGSLGNARARVLEMVRSVLPSDEWEGWEKLGWEETDLHPSNGLPRLTRSVSHPARMTLDDDDEEDDEEGDGSGRVEASGSRFLFPNRTPAAAEAIKRRRNVRSRSLGSAAVQAGGWAELVDGLKETTPDGLQRTMTAPYPAKSAGGAWLRKDGEGSSVGDGDEDSEGYFNITSPTGMERDEEEDGGSDEIIDVTDPLVGGIATSSPTRKNKPPLARAASSVRIGYAHEFGPSVAEALELSADGTKLLAYDDLPVDWRNNEHILSGYRFIPLHSSTGPIPLIKSAFAWHNETAWQYLVLNILRDAALNQPVNIHSHFIPTIVILCIIPAILYSTPLPSAHTLDTVVLALYLLAAVSCMFSSAMWHVLSGCASKKWFEWGACVDYIGISWLIAASFGTVVYNAFYCRPNLVFLYCGTNAACGALGSYLPFQRWFNMRRMKPWRIAFFLFLNFAMFAPMLQLFWVHGWAEGSVFCAAFVPSILAYVGGLLFYAFHFPECVWAGRFDTWGSSHQIWHAAIVLAIVLHYRAVFVAHGMRYDLTCAAPGAGKDVGSVVGEWFASWMAQVGINAT